MRHIGKASEINFTVHVMCLYYVPHRAILESKAGS